MTSYARRAGAGPRKASAIYDATLSMLSERGADGLTIEGVAERSGVNKTTLYRWWPSKDELIADALIHADLLAIDVADTGTVRGDLIALFEGVAGLFNREQSGPVVRAAVAAAASRPALGAHLRGFFADRLEAEGVVFERAIARGELSADVAPKLVIDLILGMVWVRVFLRQEDVTRADAEAAADAVLRGVSPR